MRVRLMRRDFLLSIPCFYFILFLLCICGVWPITASAQDVWKGGAGNWNVSTNWSAGVPTSASSVRIDNGNAVVSQVTVSDGEQSGSLTVDSDDSVIVANGGNLALYGSTVSNSGMMLLNATNGAYLSIVGTVALTGAGTLTMSNNANNLICFSCVQNTGNTLTNQSTIQGAGTIQPGCSNTFNNQGTVNANQTTPLYISICNGPSANSGTLEATNGGTLVLEGSSYGTGTFDNTGGKIQAGAGSTVTLYDSAIVKNGNLTSTTTGMTQCNGSNGRCSLDGVTITGTHQVTSEEAFLNTITNNGSVQFGTSTTPGSMDIVGSVTLKGTGTLTMSNLAGNAICFSCVQNTGDTLTNQSTIQGSGTISPGCSNTFNNQGTVNANQSTPLYISICNGPSANSGTLEATNGGTLVLEGSAYGTGTFDNTGGTIQAGAGSTVVLYDSAIVKNGNLSSTSTGKTQCNGSNGLCSLDGATITGTHQVTSQEAFLNTVTNNGSVQVGVGSTAGVLDIVGSVTLKGTGTVTLSNLASNQICFTCVQNTGNTLTNQSTIQGMGSINPGSSNNLINENIVSANQTTPLTINGNFTNLKNGTVIGTLKVAKPSTLYISGGLFGNFSGTSLTGGKYMITGTLEFDGANIVTNAASITLTGTASRIINQSAVNALANLATNTSAGSFSVMSGRMYTTTIQNGVFTNAGKVTVGVNSGFQVTAPAQNPPVFGTYNKTGGTTTVDGVLTAQGGVTINKGNLMGKGTIATSVVSSGAVTAGDSATKPGILSVSTYTQKTSGTAIGSLVIPITSDTAFGKLAVSNGASISGPLTIKRLSTYLPAIGKTYTVLTAGAITGTFSNSTVAINSGEHFAITYNKTSTPQTVTVTVVSGP